MDKRLVCVTWIDASDPKSDASWYTDKEVDDFSAEKVEVISVGWLKSETKLYLTLVSDYVLNKDGSYTWGRPTKIPAGMVQMLEYLSVIPSP